MTLPLAPLATIAAAAPPAPPIGVREIATIVLMAAGLFFSLTASIGVLRFPDLYTRMQAATKAGTLGVALMLAAAGVYFADTSVAALASVIILFFLLTAPIASHLIARAAYFVDVQRWDQTIQDDLIGCYDWDTHTLYQTPEGNTGRTERPPFDADPAD